MTLGYGQEKMSQRHLRGRKRATVCHMKDKKKGKNKDKKEAGKRKRIVLKLSINVSRERNMINLETSHSCQGSRG